MIIIHTMPLVYFVENSAFRISDIMRRMRIIYAVMFMCGMILVSMIFVSCGASKQIYTGLSNTGLPNSTDGGDIMVGGSTQISLTTSPILESNDGVLNSKGNRNEHISELLKSLPESYIVLEVIAVPLQREDTDEYVILYAQEEDAPVNVMIAQYDANNRYNFLWQRPSISYGTKNNTFLEVSDITGDYIKEIIVFGRDQYDKKVIDIFQRSDNKNLRSFQNIFSKQADGIDLLASTKEKFNNEFSTFEDNYEIIIFNIVRGSFVREYFKWDERTQSVKKFLEERFSQEEIAQQALSSLSNATNEDFKQFLTGAWYKVDKQANTRAKYKKMAIEFSENPFGILFLLEDNKGKKESYWYSWKSSFPTISQLGSIALRVHIKSNILPAIDDVMQVYIVSEDTLFIRTERVKKIRAQTTIPSDISGEYHRITNMDTMRKGFNVELHTENNVYVSNVKKYLNALEGQFKNKKNNDTVIFDYPIVSFVNNEYEQRGIYSITSINREALIEIKIGDKEALFYTIEQQDSNDADSDKGNDTTVFTLIPKSIYSNAIYNNHQNDVIILEKILVQ